MKTAIKKLFRLSVFMMVLFAAPNLCSANKPTTENQKIRYMLSYLMPGYTPPKKPRQVISEFQNFGTFIKKTAIAIKLISFAFLAPLTDSLIAWGCEEALLSHKNFKNSTTTILLGGTLYSAPYILFHKFYYNHQLFFERTINAFEEHPEYFPQTAQSILQKAITEFDTLTSEQILKIYTDLMLLAKPLEVTEKRIFNLFETIEKEAKEKNYAKAHALQMQYNELLASIA